MNINDMLKARIRMDWKDAKVELNLTENMPEITDWENDKFVGLTLTDVIDDTKLHSKSDSRRVKTYSEAEKQVIELAWNGNPLSEEDIRIINTRYFIGASRESLPPRFGTLRAGYCVAKIGGSIRIENFSDGIYVTRNVIELPLII